MFQCFLFVLLLFFSGHFAVTVTFLRPGGDGKERSGWSDWYRRMQFEDEEGSFPTCVSCCDSAPISISMWEYRPGVANSADF